MYNINKINALIKLKGLKVGVLFADSEFFQFSSITSLIFADNTSAASSSRT